MILSYIILPIRINLFQARSSIGWKAGRNLGLEERRVEKMARELRRGNNEETSSSSPQPAPYFTLAVFFFFFFFGGGGGGGG